MWLNEKRCGLFPQGCHLAFIKPFWNSFLKIKWFGRLVFSWPFFNLEENSVFLGLFWLHFYKTYYILGFFKICLIYFGKFSLKIWPLFGPFPHFRIWPFHLLGPDNPVFRFLYPLEEAKKVFKVLILKLVLSLQCLLPFECWGKIFACDGPDKKGYLFQWHKCLQIHTLPLYLSPSLTHTNYFSLSHAHAHTLTLSLFTNKQSHLGMFHGQVISV